MWNRDKEKDEEPMETTEARSDASATDDRQGPTAGDARAIIGRSITIQGEVTGDEDLTIQGHVDGSISLDEHAVTVGPDGRVDADIVARVITVEGHVDGDLDADDQIVLRGSARVEGDISAPRVVLEDGSYFRGAVDMGNESKGGGHRTGGGSSFGATSSAAGGSGGDGESGDEDSDEDET